MQTLENKIRAYNAAKAVVDAMSDLYRITGEAKHLVGYSEACESRDELRNELAITRQVQFDVEGVASPTNGLPEIC